MSERGFFCAMRHWFSVPGMVGVRSPVCVRDNCEAINPRPLTDDELDEFRYWARPGTRLREKADRLSPRRTEA